MYVSRHNRHRFRCAESCRRPRTTIHIIMIIFRFVCHFCDKTNTTNLMRCKNLSQPAGWTQIYQRSPKMCVTLFHISVYLIILICIEDPAHAFVTKNDANAIDDVPRKQLRNKTYLLIRKWSDSDNALFIHDAFNSVFFFVSHFSLSSLTRVRPRSFSR